jgi:hypothetical protein
MGAVFRAELEGPGGFRKACALKVLHPSVLVAARRLSLDLRTEARLGALLHHPNIVEVYDFGVEAGQPWISMELVDGTELSDLLRGVGKLPPTVTLELGIQLCAALEHAHGLVHEGRPAEFVHRDLKPANVIVSRDGLAKITDFGIAKAAAVTGLTTRSGVTKGTPAYMSPEQATGEPVDARSDLFSLAVILFQVATGLRLFRGGNPAATAMAVLQVDDLLDRPAVLGLADGAIPGLGDVLRWCLRRDPDERYANATLVREALQELELGLPFGPTLRRWLADQPGQGTGYRGLRAARRAERGGGIPPFDPRQDLGAAIPLDAEPPPTAEPSSPLPEAIELPPDTWPAVPRPSPIRVRRRGLATVVAAVAAGLLVGIGVGFVARGGGGGVGPELVVAPSAARSSVLLDAPRTALGEVRIEDSEVAGARASIPAAPAPRARVDREVAALGGPRLSPRAGEGLVVHAGAAAVGEAGETLDGAAAAPAAAGVEGEGQTGDDGHAGAALEGVAPVSLVLTHPKPLASVRIGQRPSLIVRTQGERLRSGSLLVRGGDSGWERHPMARYGDAPGERSEFWGTKIYVTDALAEGFEYRFEMVDLAGVGHDLAGTGGPFVVRVDPVIAAQP